MTQPTVVFFGPDGGRREGAKPELKVFLRTLLYSTSRRGQVLESLYVRLERGESQQNFPIWVYGDKKLLRGSGLHVGSDGVACDHHFLLPKDGTEMRLLAGRYRLRVFGKRVRDHHANELASIDLTITESQADELEADNAGIYFDWGPDQRAYHGHVDIKNELPIPSWLLDAAKAR